MVSLGTISTFRKAVISATATVTIALGVFVTKSYEDVPAGAANNLIWVFSLAAFGLVASGAAALALSHSETLFRGVLDGVVVNARLRSSNARMMSVPLSEKAMPKLKASKNFFCRPAKIEDGDSNQHMTSSAFVVIGSSFGVDWNKAFKSSTGPIFLCLLGCFLSGIIDLWCFSHALCVHHLMAKTVSVPLLIPFMAALVGRSALMICTMTAVYAFKRCDAPPLQISPVTALTSRQAFGDGLRLLLMQNFEERCMAIWGSASRPVPTVLVTWLKFVDRDDKRAEWSISKAILVPGTISRNGNGRIAFISWATRSGPSFVPKIETMFLDFELVVTPDSDVVRVYLDLTTENETCTFITFFENDLLNLIGAVVTVESVETDSTTDFSLSAHDHLYCVEW